MKILKQNEDAKRVPATCGVAARRYFICPVVAILGILIAACATDTSANVSAALSVAKTRACRKVVLSGAVMQGKEWRAVVGEGWVFRVIPIGSGQTPLSDAVAGKAPLRFNYTGWDLVMDRESGAGYPDALLLATAPYGSVNEREIGTTYGMRAQDAIAWEPRKFHFFTRVGQMQRARALYEAIFAGVGKTAEHSEQAQAKRSASASADLLNLISNDPELGYGQFSITDASLVLGSSDPPAYASGWLAHLSQVPHRVEQASSEEPGYAREGSAKLGELHSIQFAATLWFPGAWKVPAGLRSEPANCAE